MGRPSVLLLVAAILGVSPGLTSAPVTDALGIYHWGADYQITSEPKLIEGANLIQSLGAHTISLALSPRYGTEDYSGETFGPGPITSDTQLAETADFQRLFAMPFRTYILMTLTFGTARWSLGPHPRGLMTDAQAARETQEIHDLALYLLHTYQGTGKTFILKNWEGDNFMDEDASYSLTYVPTATQVQGMVQWFKARHAGLVQARSEAADMSGVQVLDAVEFNLVGRVKHGTASMLNSVIPNVQSDLVSYSTWEVIGPAATNALARTIASDLEFVRKYTGGRPLMIGEFGFSEKKFPDAAARTQIAAEAFLKAGCPYVIDWVVEDSAQSRGLGLVRSDGSHSGQWSVLSQMLHH